MSEERIIILGMIIIVAFILIYYLYRYLVYIFRKKRLATYSIKASNSSLIFNIIDVITKRLAITRYYKKRISKYDKYLDSDGVITSNHILTIKLLIAIILTLIYLLECVLFNFKINIFVIIMCLVIGYYIVDIFLINRYKNKLNVFDNNITKIMIIMNNGYHINKNHVEVVEDIILEVDGLLKKELKQVKNDLDNGLDISEAYYKMYERTNDKKILYISRLLGLNTKYGISIIDICNRLEKDINNREKKEVYIKRLDNTSKLMYLVLAILPVFSFIVLILLNNSMISLISNSLIFIEVLLYAIYLLILKSVIRG